MKKYFVILCLAAGTSVALTSCSVSSHVEVAQGVDFNTYKTFGWANTSENPPANRVDNDIVDNNIKNAISTQLENKGWKENDQKPDVLLDYNVLVEKGVKKETRPVYAYPYSQYFYNPWRRRIGYIYNPTLLAGYHTYNVPFKEGKLTINMIDAKTNKLVWQGWSVADVTHKNISTQEAQAGVKSIFKKFDFPKTNS